MDAAKINAESTRDLLNEYIQCIIRYMHLYYEWWDQTPLDQLCSRSQLFISLNCLRAFALHTKLLRISFLCGYDDIDM